jgi:hypothetical protein
MGYLQASVESASEGRTRGVERGLCHCVVFLLEDERDDIAGAGSLIMVVCSEAHEGRSCGRRTTKEGLYWMSPSGPPATTSISVDCTGRATIRPSKAEAAKSLENITSVSEMSCCRAKERGLTEIERKGCPMSH